MSLRGNAFLYQGEELGLPQAHVAFADLQDWEAIANWPRTLGRDGARTPIPWRDSAPYAGFSRVKPWLPVEPRHLPLSVASQEHNHASMLQFSRAAIAMRKRTLALQTGSMIVIEASDDILHFQRHLSGMTLQCVFNLGSTPTSRSHTTPMTMVFDSILGDGAHGATAPTTLPPFSGFLAIAKS
jgi:alpha-glucosidase